MDPTETTITTKVVTHRYTTQTSTLVIEYEIPTSQGVKTVELKITPELHQSSLALDFFSYVLGPNRKTVEQSSHATLTVPTITPAPEPTERYPGIATAIPDNNGTAPPSQEVAYSARAGKASAMPTHDTAAAAKEPEGQPFSLDNLFSCSPTLSSRIPTGLLSSTEKITCAEPPARNYPRDNRPTRPEWLSQFPIVWCQDSAAFAEWYMNKFMTPPRKLQPHYLSLMLYRETLAFCKEMEHHFPKLVHEHDYARMLAQIFAAGAEDPTVARSIRKYMSRNEFHLFNACYQSLHGPHFPALPHDPIVRIGQFIDGEIIDEDSIYACFRIVHEHVLHETDYQQ
jgi:hypothetical protein